MRGTAAACGPGYKKPTCKVFAACCARAVSGQATVAAAPPSVVIKSRRLTQAPHSRHSRMRGPAASAFRANFNCRERLQQEFAVGEMGFNVKVHSSNFEPAMSPKGQTAKSTSCRAASALASNSDIDRWSKGVTAPRDHFSFPGMSCCRRAQQPPRPRPDWRQRRACVEGNVAVLSPPERLRTPVNRLTESAPAAAVGTASPYPSWRAVRAPSSACRLFEQGGFLSLRMEVVETGRRGLGIGSNGHCTQHKRGSGQRHCEFSHKSSSACRTRTPAHLTQFCRRCRCRRDVRFTCHIT